MWEKYQKSLEAPLIFFPAGTHMHTKVFMLESSHFDINSRLTNEGGFTFFFTKKCNENGELDFNEILGVYGTVYHELAHYYYGDKFSSVIDDEKNASLITFCAEFTTSGFKTYKFSSVSQGMEPKEILEKVKISKRNEPMAYNSVLGKLLSEREIWLSLGKPEIINKSTDSEKILNICSRVGRRI